MPTCWTRNPNCWANVAIRTTSCLTSNRSCSSNCYRIKILKLYIRFCLNWKTSVNWLLTALKLSYNSPFLKCIVLQYHCCQPSLVWWPCDDHERGTFVCCTGAALPASDWRGWCLLAASVTKIVLVDRLCAIGNAAFFPVGPILFPCTD